MRINIVIFIVALLVGIAGGFYLALYIQTQIALLAGVAVLFAFLAWLGSGTEIIGLLRDWYKEEHEKVEFTVEYNPQVSPFQYAPMLEIMTVTGQRTNISRKYIKIGIRNTGGIVAKQCRATLQVLTSVPPTTRLPSGEQKVLLWDTGQNYQDIGINRAEYLHVVLSDSRLGVVIPAAENCFALVSTPDTVNMIPAGGIRAQDCMGQGAIDFRLIVTSESGESIETTLRVHVTTNWQDLAMEKV